MLPKDSVLSDKQSQTISFLLKATPNKTHLSVKCWNQPAPTAHKEQSRFCLTVGLFWLHRACRLSARRNDRALSSPRLLRRQRDGCTSQEPLRLQLSLPGATAKVPYFSETLWCVGESGLVLGCLQCLSVCLWLVKQDSHNHTKSYEAAFTVHRRSERCMSDKTRHLNHGALLSCYLRRCIIVVIWFS